ncbi:TetR family transcriptional regulator [Brevibacillus reuszeri]|uniref:Transcriptional regulator n=1 Tax=Brevibacillus reuszeri TaxID=54915 RepID=A0A0K9YRW3_9BACL|nr:TetR/AcrR family transcriptional regulator [Brevibacillus reuszeri]KNB71367.1 transcriptional regulator [Brevibacillus reuszeri]MED1857818.1 TetR/AcrR family transcriptional regulator [Brevibacillus reuszeri]GED66351.1 TetR family transcriptional regulator [Brevibacillus reuszeri]
MKTSKAEQAKLTISKLTEVARDFFTTYGYADAAMEDLVKKAGLTRGALYHHFGNKEGLFMAILDLVQKEIAERVETEAGKSSDPWEQLLLGCLAFVSAAVENQNRRILLIDGPSVVGWEAWRKMDEQHSMRLLREQLEDMAQQGYLKSFSINAMTHLLSGAMNEGVLWVAQMPDQEQALLEIKTALSLLLEGWKAK